MTVTFLMKTKLSLSIAIIYSILLLSCKKEPERIEDYFVKFATVEVNESNISFRLDNEKVLRPKNSTNVELENGNRVILNYTPLENEFITINQIRRIFLDEIRNEGYPERLKVSPVKIVTMWVSGHYLNMSFEVDYHSKSHSAALLRDVNAIVPTLYFSYSREDDPPGAPTLTYLSFDLKSLGDEDFIVYVNTYDSMRKFTFKVD